MRVNSGGNNIPSNGKRSPSVSASGNEEAESTPQNQGQEGIAPTQERKETPFFFFSFYFFFFLLYIPKPKPKPKRHRSSPQEDNQRSPQSIRMPRLRVKKGFPIASQDGSHMSLSVPSELIVGIGLCPSMYCAHFSQPQCLSYYHYLLPRLVRSSQPLV